MERKRNRMDLLFLIVLVSVFANGIVLASRSMDNREIKRQLKLLNKHAVKTIKVVISLSVFLLLQFLLVIHFT